MVPAAPALYSPHAMTIESYLFRAFASVNAENMCEYARIQCEHGANTVRILRIWCECGANMARTRREYDANPANLVQI